MSRVRITSICQRTNNIINCAQEGASLITKHDEIMSPTPAQALMSSEPNHSSTFQILLIFPNTSHISKYFSYC